MSDLLFAPRVLWDLVKDLNAAKPARLSNLCDPGHSLEETFPGCQIQTRGMLP